MGLPRLEPEHRPFDYARVGSYSHRSLSVFSLPSLLKLKRPLFSLEVFNMCPYHLDRIPRILVDLLPCVCIPQFLFPQIASALVGFYR